MSCPYRRPGAAAPQLAMGIGVGHGAEG